MKYNETLLLETSVSQLRCHNMCDSIVTTPHSIKASIMECCGSDFVYTPLFDSKSAKEVSVCLDRFIDSSIMCWL